MSRKSTIRLPKVIELEELNSDLLAACKALQMEARARNCGLRIADEAIAKAEKYNAPN